MQATDALVLESALHGINFMKIDKRLLDKFVAMCEKFSLDPQEFTLKLEAFLINKCIKYEDVTIAHIGPFEVELSREKSKAPIRDRNSTAAKSDIKTPSSNINTNNKRPNTYSTPDSFKNKIPNNNNAALSQSDILISPSAISPTIHQTPYKVRKNSGQVLLSLNGGLSTRGPFLPSIQTPLGMRCKISYKDDKYFNNNIFRRYRFMFTSLHERALAFDNELIRLQEHMCSTTGITDIQPVGIPSQDVIWVCGRICCESSEGRINKSSVELEGSARYSGGRRVHLDLEEVPNFALFPGQVVLVEGVNSSGRRMVARRIIEGLPRPHPRTPVSLLREYHLSSSFMNKAPLHVIIAAGPFTTSDNLDYEPLNDLIKIVFEKKPDVLILSGPFVDITQPQLSSDNDVTLKEISEDDEITGSHRASYEMIFVEKVIRDGLSVLFNTDGDEGVGYLPTNIILIPSLLDAHHDYVFPQPPFGDRDRIDTPFFEEPLGVLNVPFSDENDVKRRVHLLPNPCLFSINEVVFGVTSQDILHAMSSSDVSTILDGRLARLAGHMMQQHSFFPLFPAPLGSQLDFRHTRHWQMPVTPDVLVLPSKLNPIAKEVCGSLVINPGQLAKFESGGSYAEMHIQPFQDSDFSAFEASQSTQSSTKDAEESKLMEHKVASRALVNIFKI